MELLQVVHLKLDGSDTELMDDGCRWISGALCFKNTWSCRVALYFCDSESIYQHYITQISISSDRYIVDISAITLGFHHMIYRDILMSN